jgi:hypothetical protein
MTRQELRERFRVENPEITERVLTDAVLNLWLKLGNKEVCTATRCILSNEAETFDTVADTQFYDLQSRITKFLDIDDMPGGGVYYDDVPLTKTTPGEMNSIRRNWRTDESGTPKRYWRRGRYLWLDVPPDAVVELAIDCYLIPDDFDSDVESPYNDLTHLETYHDALSKYLQWRAKEKVGKADEALKAKTDYLDYVKWMKKMVQGYNQHAVFMRRAENT